MVIYYGTIRKKNTNKNKSWAIKWDLYLPTPQRVHERGTCVGLGISGFPTYWESCIVHDGFPRNRIQESKGPFGGWIDPTPIG